MRKTGEKNTPNEYEIMWRCRGEEAKGCDFACGWIGDCCNSFRPFRHKNKLMKAVWTILVFSSYNN